MYSIGGGKYEYLTSNLESVLSHEYPLAARLLAEHLTFPLEVFCMLIVAFCGFFLGEHLAFPLPCPCAAH